MGIVPMNESGLKSALEPVCPYCGGDASLVVSSTDRNRRTTSAKFDYFGCSQCGLIFMHAPPEDLTPFYAGGYDAIPVSISELQSIAADERYRIDPILRYKGKGRFLEIGPWRGVLCCGMKDAGFSVTAIEMNSACVDF